MGVSPWVDQHGRGVDASLPRLVAAERLDGRNAEEGELVAEEAGAAAAGRGVLERGVGGASVQRGRRFVRGEHDWHYTPRAGRLKTG